MSGEAWMILGAGLLLAVGARAALNPATTAGGGSVWGDDSGGSDPAPDEPDRGDANVRAFLFMIRTAEGTADGNGYRALFGHRPGAPRLFTSWADHPRIATRFTDGRGRQLWTSAAGAYQFMAVSPLPAPFSGSTSVDTWDRIRRQLGLQDFSPASQDAAAVELIRQRGALADVRAGRIAQAVDKCRAEWASLPGAGYDQPERGLDELLTAYSSAGGSFA